MNVKKLTAVILCFILLLGTLTIADSLNAFASGYATVEYYDTDGTLLKSDTGAPNGEVQDYFPTAPTRKFIGFYTEDEKLFDGKLGADGSAIKVYAKWYTNLFDFDGSSPYNQYAFKEGSTGNPKTNHRRWGVVDNALKYSFTYNADVGIGGNVGSAYGNGGVGAVPVGILNDDGSVYRLLPYTTYRIEFDYKVTEIDAVNSPDGMVIRVDRANPSDMISNERRGLEYWQTVAGLSNRVVDLDDSLDDSDVAEDKIIELDLIKVTEASDSWQSFSYTFTTFDWVNRSSSVDTSNCNALVIQASGYGVLYVDNIRVIQEDDAVDYQIYDIDGKTVLKSDFGFPNDTVRLETPAQPQKTLVGFYSDIACKNPIEDITLTLGAENKAFAKWDSENPISFDMNNGLDIKSFTLSKYADLPDFDTYITMCDYDSADFDGMEFVGWYSADGEQIKTVSKAQTRANNNLYAAFDYSENLDNSVTNVKLYGYFGKTIDIMKLEPQNTYEVDITIGSDASNLNLELLSGSISQVVILNKKSVYSGYNVKAIFKATSFGAACDLVLRSNKYVNITSFKITRLSKTDADEKLSNLVTNYTLAAGMDRLVVDDRISLDFDYENGLVKTKLSDDYYVVPDGLALNGNKLFINPEIEKIQDNDINGETNDILLSDTGEEYRINNDGNEKFDLSIRLAKKGDNAAFGVVGALEAGNTNDAMRFIIRVGAQNTNIVLYNNKTFTIVEKGAVVSTRTDNQLTLDSNNTIKLVANSSIYNKTDCYFDYTVRVSGITDQYKNRTVVCRGYMILSDNNGKEFTIYSDNALATNFNRVKEDKDGKFIDVIKSFDFTAPDYTIVYPKFNTSYLVVMRLEELAQQLSDTYSIDVSIVKDTESSAKEILVGNTARSEEISIADDEYKICIKDQKLMLLGNSPEALVSAVDKLSRLIVAGNVLYDGYSFTDKIDDIGDKRIQDYHEVWTDNFDGDTIDKKWEVYTEMSTYETFRTVPNPFKMFRSSDKDHVLLKNGKLNQYISRPSEYYGVSAKMTTRNSLWFKYGYTEISAKITPELGTGMAFWLVGECEDPNDPDEFSTKRMSVEFDILEVFGNSKYYKNTSHRHRAGGSSMSIDKWEEDQSKITISGNDWQTCEGEEDDLFSDEYHTFGFLWDENSYSFLLDGEVVYSLDYSNSEKIKELIDSNPVHLVISCGANSETATNFGDKGSLVSENTDWNYGTESSIEYVHIYQKSGQYCGKSRESVLDPKEIYGNWVGGIIIN